MRPADISRTTQALRGLGERAEPPHDHPLMRFPAPSRGPVPPALEEIYRWWPNPPPHREGRQAGDEIDLAASAARQVVTFLDLPDAIPGVWWWWAQSIGTAGDLVNVTWTLTMNGKPLVEFSALRSRDPFGSLSIPQWVGVIVPAGARLVVLATNETALAINSVGAYIRAYWSRR